MRERTASELENTPMVGVGVKVSVGVGVRGVVPAGTRPMGFEKRRSGGALDYGAVL